MRLCRIDNATLVISHLITRCGLAGRLEKQGYTFVCAANPNVNRLTIGVLALVGGRAAGLSIRTKATLLAAKARGVPLGNHANLSRRDVGAACGNATEPAEAIARAADLMPIMAEIRAEGCSSLRQLANGLNERGIRRPRGGQ